MLDLGFVWSGGMGGFFVDGDGWNWPTMEQSHIEPISIVRGCRTQSHALIIMEFAVCRDQYV